MPSWMQSPPQQQQGPSLQQRARQAGETALVANKLYNTVRNWNDAPTGRIVGTEGGAPVMTAGDVGGAGGAAAGGEAAGAAAGAGEAASAGSIVGEVASVLPEVAAVAL